MFGEGISRVGDILDIAAGIDVVSKSGAWYAYEGNKIGQGRENAKQYQNFFQKFSRNLFSLPNVVGLQLTPVQHEPAFPVHLNFIAASETGNISGSGYR